MPDSFFEIALKTIQEQKKPANAKLKMRAMLSLGGKNPQFLHTMHEGLAQQFPVLIYKQMKNHWVELWTQTLKHEDIPLIQTYWAYLNIRQQTILLNKIEETLPYEEFQIFRNKVDIKKPSDISVALKDLKVGQIDNILYYIEHCGDLGRTEYKKIVKAVKNTYYQNGEMFILQSAAQKYKDSSNALYIYEPIGFKELAANASQFKDWINFQHEILANLKDNELVSNLYQLILPDMNQRVSGFINKLLETFSIIYEYEKTLNTVDTVRNINTLLAQPYCLKKLEKYGIDFSTHGLSHFIDYLEQDPAQCKKIIDNFDSDYDEAFIDIYKKVRHIIKSCELHDNLTQTLKEKHIVKKYMKI